jgi:hypothetical protein
MTEPPVADEPPTTIVPPAAVEPPVADEPPVAVEPLVVDPPWETELVCDCPPDAGVPPLDRTAPELVGLVVAPPVLTLLAAVAAPPVLPPEPAPGGELSELQASSEQVARARMPTKTRLRQVFIFGNS